ncbi:unnamed protein product [Dicrocoelium dendriticum]|nr:unnamed protein product [Dicrocoelium dendriticum]
MWTSNNRRTGLVWLTCVLVTYLCNCQAIYTFTSSETTSNLPDTTTVTTSSTSTEPQTTSQPSISTGE